MELCINIQIPSYIYTLPPIRALPELVGRMSCKTCNTQTLPRDSWCMGCETVQYCGESCQREDWPEHKAVCQRGASAAIGKHYWMKDAVKHPESFSSHADSEDMSTGEYARHVLHGRKHHHGTTEKRRAVLAQTFAKYRGHRSRHYGDEYESDSDSDEGYHEGEQRKHAFSVSLF
jgi:hypothetical protein